MVGRAQFVGSTVGCLGKLGLDPESLGNPPAGSREDGGRQKRGENVTMTFWGLKYIVVFVAFSQQLQC